MDTSKSNIFIQHPQYGTLSYLSVFLSYAGSPIVFSVKNNEDDCFICYELDDSDRERKACSYVIAPIEKVWLDFHVDNRSSLSKILKSLPLLSLTKVSYNRSMLGGNEDKVTHDFYTANNIPIKMPKENIFLNNPLKTNKKDSVTFKSNNVEDIESKINLIILKLIEINRSDKYLVNFSSKGLDGSVSFSIYVINKESNMFDLLKRGKVTLFSDDNDIANTLTFLKKVIETTKN